MKTLIIRKRLISLVVLTAVGVIGIAWLIDTKPWLSPYPPLSEVIWTSNKDFSAFYGPGTPQSSKLVARIGTMKDMGYLPSDFHGFREPTLITLAFFAAGTKEGDKFSSDYPIIVGGFTPEVGQWLREEYLQTISKK